MDKNEILWRPTRGSTGKHARVPTIAAAVEAATAVLAILHAKELAGRVAAVTLARTGPVRGIGGVATGLAIVESGLAGISAAGVVAPAAAGRRRLGRRCRPWRLWWLVCGSGCPGSPVSVGGRNGRARRGYSDRCWDDT